MQFGSCLAGSAATTAAERCSDAEESGEGRRVAAERVLLVEHGSVAGAVEAIAARRLVAVAVMTGDCSGRMDVPSETAQRVERDQ